jgi:hypothetical protein
MMMQAADVGHSNHCTDFGGLDRTWLRAIHIEGQMRAKLVIRGDIFWQKPPEMRLVEDDHMVEQVAPDTADEPLHGGMLPRTTGRNLHLLASHVADTLLKRVTGDAVKVADHVPRRFVPRKGFDDLRGGPLGRGRFRHVDVDKAPTRMRQHDAHDEPPEGHGWDGEEVTGEDVFDMIG